MRPGAFIRPARGGELLVVIEIPAESEVPPAVHSAIAVTGAPDRHLATLGWQPSVWQVRSFGAIARLQPRHPHT
jgi:hypothetical protein